MKTLLKISASLLAFIALIVLSAVILLATFVSPNNFKNQISQQVYNYTGRHLTLQGDLHWSFFPWLGLQINDAILENAAGFGKAPFAKINHANVAIKLAPLMKRNVEVGKITLDGLEVNLIKNAKGVTNWQDLTAKAAKQASSIQTTSIASNDPDVTTSTTATGAAKPLTFSVAAIEIVNSKISWTDQQKGQQILLDQLKLHSKNIKADDAFPISLQFNLHSKQPDINGMIATQAQLNPQITQQIYRLQNLQMTSNLTGKALPNNKLDLDLKGYLTFNAALKTLQGQIQTDQLQMSNFKASNVLLAFNNQNSILDLNPIRAQLYQGNYTGQIKLNFQNKVPQITSNVVLTGVQAEPLFRDLAKVTRLRLTGTGNITANLNTRGDSSDTILKNLNGQGNFALNNGVLYGINIPYWIGTGVALLQKQPMPTITNDKQTNFGNLTGTFTIKNGIFQNDDLTMRSNQLAVNGNGTADLTLQQLNYRLNAQLVDAVNNQPKGDPIPLLITGSFSHPSIRPSVGDILKTGLKNQLLKNKEAIGNQLQKFLGKDTGSKIQNQLQNLFNR